MYKMISKTSLIFIFIGLLSGCATRVITSPKNIALRDANYQDKVLAIMIYGEDNPAYAERLRQNDNSWFLNRWFCGQGEISVLGEPYSYEGQSIPSDDTYTEISSVIYNRLRGHNAFKHVVIVKDRAEATTINADFLLVFHINKCYARGLGANANIFQWLTYQGLIDMDVIVYDLYNNQRISSQNIISRATNTSVWQTKEMRDYKRRRLLKGVTANNAVSEITF